MCLADLKVISLAISEAFAGSDVAGIRTTATKSEDGKSWIINGTKKWITGGMHSDYFTVGTKVSCSLRESKAQLMEDRWWIDRIPRTPRRRSRD